MPGKILIAEDDMLQQQMLETLVRRKLPQEPILAEHGRAALDILRKDTSHSIVLVIMDLNMPVMGGQETLEIIQQTHPHIPVIMLTGSTDITDAVDAMKAGACDFVSKPFQGERMITTIENALKLNALKKEVSRLKREQSGQHDFTSIIGHDQGLKACVEMGRKAATSDIPALITGPTGSGKEVFSRAIHGESHRADRAFIAVNCGALPAQLVESILFGHEKGAFTGATDKMPGKFKEADGGTIFLDEIGELPLDAQVKLLRVLQQKEVETVGAANPTPVNVRILSATNRDLSEEVAAGRFREDLYFRLNVLEITLPALKERKEDIIPLAMYFIDRISSQAAKVPLSLARDAQDYLMENDWPGNVRELENAINRAIVLSNGQVLTASDFTQNTAQSKNQKTGQLISTDNRTENAFIHVDGTLKTMEEIEREAIRIALKQHENNVTQAAKSLGMSKSTFYRKLSEQN